MLLKCDEQSGARLGVVVNQQNNVSMKFVTWITVELNIRTFSAVHCT
jgi:hypothetical protein